LRHELAVNNADLPFTPFPFRHHLLWVPGTQGFWNRENTDVQKPVPIVRYTTHSRHDNTFVKLHKHCPERNVKR